MSDGAENGIDRVAGNEIAMVSAEMALSFVFTDHGFNGRAATELALDSAEHAALLA